MNALFTIAKRQHQPGKRPMVSVWAVCALRQTGGKSS
jgi:hypothetical protein